MKITCEACNTRYSIPDEKIRGAGKTFKIRCKSCGEMMTVKGVGDAGDAGAGGEDAVWYYAVGNDRRGPIARSALASLVASGEVTAQTYVWQNGMANWSLLETVPELQDLLDASSAQAEDDAGDAAEDATDTAYMSQADLLAAQAAFAGEVAAAAAPAPEPVVPDEPEAPIGGLFGDEGYGGEDDHPFASVASSPASAPVAAPAPVAAAPAPKPAAAPAKAEDDDLFNFDVPSPNDDPGNVHSRRDSSVLFSLDDLGGGDKKGMSKEEALVTESSGLIDIRAVASAQKKSASDNPFAETGGASSLLQPSRANVAAVSVPIVQKKSGGAGPWIAVAAVVLVLGGGGVAWFLMNQNKTEPAAPTAGQVVTPADPTPPVAEDPKNATVAKAEEPKPAEPEKKEEPPAAAEPEKKDEAAVEGDKKEEPAGEGENTEAAAVAPEKVEDPAAEKARKERERKLREARAAQGETKPTEVKKDEPKREPTPTADTKQNTKDVNNLLAGLQKPKVEEGGDTAPSDALPQRLAAPIVQKAVRSASGKFSACYKRMSPVAGGVTVGTSFTIVSTGSVSSARVSNPGGTTPEVQGCIVDALKGLNFPKFKDPQMVVNYPLRLQ